MGNVVTSFLVGGYFADKKPQIPPNFDNIESLRKRYYQTKNKIIIKLFMTRKKMEQVIVHDLLQNFKYTF